MRRRSTLARNAAVGFGVATVLGAAVGLAYSAYAVLFNPIVGDAGSVDPIVYAVLGLFPLLVLPVGVGVRRNAPAWSWAGSVLLLAGGVLPHAFWFLYLGTAGLGILTSLALSASVYLE